MWLQNKPQFISGKNMFWNSTENTHILAIFAEKYNVDPLIKVECEIDKTDSLLKCHKCDKSYPTKFELNNHKKENHGYSIDWQCQLECVHTVEW